MSNQIIDLDTKSPSFVRAGLSHNDVDILFRKPIIRDTVFDLNELNGAFVDYPETLRLMGHLKRWNMSVNRGDRTSEKELDLFNHLYSMLKCIKYEQSSIQQGNLKKLESWFMSNFQKHKVIDYQIKKQNLDFDEKNRQFQSRQAHEQLKNYIKPYQICLKLFEYQKQMKKSKQQRQNQSIERCIRRRNKQQIGKLIEERQEKEVLRTVEEFSQNRAKRRMIQDKISLKKRFNIDKQNEQQIPSFCIKQSKSLHAGAFNNYYNQELKNDFGNDFKMGDFKIIDFIKKANKTQYFGFNKNNINSQHQKVRAATPPTFSKMNKRRLSKNKGTTLKIRSEVSSASGYRLLINPFLQKESKKKKK